MNGSRRLITEPVQDSLLSHPHLLKCFGACTDVNNVPLLILERMSTSLRAVLAQTGKPLSLPDGLIVIEAVAAALFYLHNLAQNPIVHRDLSSDVPLDIADSGAILNVKLSDFGSAQFVGQTQTNVPGAAIYSAPEVRVLAALDSVRFADERPRTTAGSSKSYRSVECGPIARYEDARREMYQWQLGGPTDLLVYFKNTTIAMKRIYHTIKCELFH